MTLSKSSSSRGRKICMHAGLAALLTCVSSSVHAELKLENGVAPHEKIDALYEKLSDAVAALDAKALSDIYAKDGYYLVPTSPMIQGIAGITSNWDGWLAWIKESRGSLRMDFRLVAREIHGDTIGYDVGYAKTLQKRPNEPDEIIETKFLVVNKKQADGTWRFQVDTYSELKKK